MTNHSDALMRDQWGFLELENPEVSSGGVTICCTQEGCIMKINGDSKNVGELRGSDSVETHDGKFYIKTQYGANSFSQYFGDNPTFSGAQFIQTYEIETILRKRQSSAVLNMG